LLPHNRMTNRTGRGSRRNAWGSTMTATTLQPMLQSIDRDLLGPQLGTLEMVRESVLAADLQRR